MFSVGLYHFSFFVGHYVGASIDEAVAPGAILLVVLVSSDFYPAIRSLDEGGSVQESANRSELGHVSAFEWVGLDDALLSDLFALSEGAQLHDLVVLVNKDTEAMGLELVVDVKVLTPEEVALVSTHFDMVSFDKLGRADQLVGQELLNIEYERPVFVDAILNILVQLRDFSLDLPQNSQLILDLRFGRVADPLLVLEPPRHLIIILAHLVCEFGLPSLDLLSDTLGVYVDFSAWGFADTY